MKTQNCQIFKFSRDTGNTDLYVHISHFLLKQNLSLKQNLREGVLWSPSLLTLFLGGSKSLQMVIAAMKLKDAYSLGGKLWPT